ncbi:hypothetical protein BDZ88DRAFT_414026 [Geranomyces variabilis]|nr:hypothetical protein BDZ88DRAFT_414026 [Geranomyces variabilis]
MCCVHVKLFLVCVHSETNRAAAAACRLVCPQAARTSPSLDPKRNGRCCQGSPRVFPGVRRQDNSAQAVADSPHQFLWPAGRSVPHDRPHQWRADRLGNLQWMPLSKNYRKGGNSGIEPRTFTVIDMTDPAIPPINQQDWRRHPRVPVEVSKQGYVRLAGSSSLLPMTARYYGHRGIRVPGISQLPLPVHRLVYETWADPLLFKFFYYTLGA